MTLTFIHGSKISSPSSGRGSWAGLSTSTSSPSALSTRYSTLGAVIRISRSYSRSRRSWTMARRVAGQRGRGGRVVVGDGIAHPTVAHGLEAGGHVAHLAGGEPVGRREG